MGRSVSRVTFLEVTVLIECGREVSPDPSMKESCGLVLFVHILLISCFVCSRIFIYNYKRSFKVS